MKSLLVTPAPESFPSLDFNGLGRNLRSAAAMARKPTENTVSAISEGAANVPVGSPPSRDRQRVNCFPAGARHDRSLAGVLIETQNFGQKNGGQKNTDKN